MRLAATSKPELAAQDLRRRSRRILVRAVYDLAMPVRFQAKDLPIAPFIVRSGGGDGPVSEWQAKGGVLVSYRAPAVTVPHEACLFAECPLDLSDLNKFCYASDICVLTVPPSWRQHHEAAERLFPSEQSCRRFYDTVCGALLTGSGERYMAIADALGVTDDRLTAISDDALREVLVATTRSLSPIRRACVRAQSHFKVSRIILRSRPKDPAMGSVYDEIGKLPMEGPAHLVMGSALQRHSYSWKRQLMSMGQSGCIEQLPRVGFYRPDIIRPDWTKIAEAHAGAKAALARTIATVATLPDLSSVRRINRAKQPARGPLQRSSAPV